MTTSPVYNLADFNDDELIEHSFKLLAAAFSDPNVVKELNANIAFAFKPGAYKLGEFNFVDGTMSPTYKTVYVNGAAKGKAKGVSQETNEKNAPALTFTMYANEWRDILSNRLDCIASFMGGIVKVEGDVSLAMKLPSIVKLCRGHNLEAKNEG